MICPMSCCFVRRGWFSEKCKFNTFSAQMVKFQSRFILDEQVFTSQGRIAFAWIAANEYKAQTRPFPFFFFPSFRKGAEWYTGEIYRVVIKIPSASWSRNDENNLERSGFLPPIFLAARSPIQIGIFSWEASIIANYTCSSVIRTALTPRVSLNYMRWTKVLIITAAQRYHLLSYR